MIEFTSTNTNIDTQTARCAHLLAAVLSRALLDLMDRPTKEETRKRQNTNGPALSSLRFFFGEDAPRFRAYSKLIGLNPDVFLVRLREANFYTVDQHRFSAVQIRAMRMRISWFDRKCSMDAIVIAESKAWRVANPLC